MWKHIYGDWSQIPAKCTNTKPTNWLQTPAKRVLRQTPPQVSPQPRLHFLLSESPPSGLIYPIFSTSHDRSTRAVTTYISGGLTLGTGTYLRFEIRMATNSVSDVNQCLCGVQEPLWRVERKSVWPVWAGRHAVTSQHCVTTSSYAKL
jgi:hypothetical protein